jgi:hypothetical protein
MRASGVFERGMPYAACGLDYLRDPLSFAGDRSQRLAIPGRQVVFERLDPRHVGLIDDEQVGDLHHARLHGLDIVAGAGGEHN